MPPTLVTARLIFEEAQDLLKIESSSIGIPGMEEPRTIGWINRLQEKFFDGFTRNSQTFPKYMRRFATAHAKPAAIAAGYIGAGDDFLDLEDGCVFPEDGGAFLIKGECCNFGFYTSRTKNRLEGVYGIEMDHKEGVEVIPLYQLPDDFRRIYNVPCFRGDQGWGFLLQEDGCYLLQEDGCRIVIDDPNTYCTGNRFTIVDDIVGNRQFAHINGNGGSMKYEYEKYPKQITDMEDVMDIPRPHYFWMVWGLVDIWKRVEDQEADTTYEKREMELIFKAAAMKRTLRKKLRVATRRYSNVGSRCYYHNGRNSSDCC
jgi:hypothetical protein